MRRSSSARVSLPCSFLALAMTSYDDAMNGDLHGPTSHWYVSQRLRLHYVDWGNEGAPPMLLVHGGRDHCRNWDWVARALRDALETDPRKADAVPSTKGTL